MAINITMPALSPTMEEGNLAKWLVKEGDSVASGDIIAEIETDKATMEVEAVDEGVITKILVAEGSEGVKVNTPIAVIAEEGEDASTVTVQETSTAPVEKIVAPTSLTEPVLETELAPKTAMPRSDKNRVFASPLARRVASENSLDIATIKGSGPRGRIILRDVTEAIENGGVSTSDVVDAKPAPAPTAPSDKEILQIFKEGEYELLPHDNMRKVIARRLVQSKQTIPHFYLTLECKLDALLALRAQINAAAPLIDDKREYKLSVNDFIIKALGLALRDVPDANVSWTSNDMVQHKTCDVGVAVSIPGGLITPVVRQVEKKSLTTISSEMKDLAGRARNRKLLPEEYQGGSTAVSNLGMFGIKEFSAVINPPQATILAVGAGEKRAVIQGDEVRIATMMSATLSTDHRAVDGVLGAKLIGAFKRYIENPVTMLI